MMGVRGALPILGAFLLATGAAAQKNNPAEAADSGAVAFRERVREGTARFADRNAAIRGGYRAVGGDFPAMGRHWVHPGIILRGKIEPDSPAILSYAEIAGVPVLVGVAFAVPLKPGEKPPPIAGRAREWHEHNGSVAEESLVAQHQHGSADAPTRLAILHVWSGIDNPAGVFATDNWALPFVRVGLAVPERLPLGAARSLSLLSGGADYFAMLLGPVHGRSAEVARLLSAARQEAQLAVESGESGNALNFGQIGRLEQVWRGLVASVEGVVGESARPLSPGATPER